MERKLATIATILDIQPIPGADAIDVATIRGWKVVVKKGEFKVGDLCVYCEIDSVMPPRKEFEFLASRKYRIKTVKLKGQLSQGIAFPVDILLLSDSGTVPPPIEDGSDVTEFLGIVKYEIPIPPQLQGTVKGTFPGFLQKTDEERIQNMTWALDSYKGTEFYVTEKLDGTSATFFLNGDDFGVCSRNLELKESEGNTYWKVARALDLENKMRAFAQEFGAKAFALQGELIGEGIQNNKYRIQGHTVKFFSLWNIERGEYAPYFVFVPAMKFLGLETVPILAENLILNMSLPEILAFSEGKSQLNPNQEREGIVLRTIKTADHVSFKVINNKYLLKEE